MDLYRPSAPDATARPRPTVLRRSTPRPPRLDRRRARQRGDCAGVENRLVMRAVDSRFIAADNLRQLRALLNSNRMEGFRRALFVFPFVFNPGAQLARNILDQCAAQKDIQALDAVANRENRLAVREGVSRSAKSFARGVDRAEPIGDGARHEKEMAPGPRDCRTIRSRQESGRSSPTPHRNGPGRSRPAHPLPGSHPATYCSILLKSPVSSSLRVRYGMPMRGFVLASGFMKRHPIIVAQKRTTGRAPSAMGPTRRSREQ